MKNTNRTPAGKMRVAVILTLLCLSMSAPVVFGRKADLDDYVGTYPSTKFSDYSYFSYNRNPPLKSALNSLGNVPVVSYSKRTRSYTVRNRTSIPGILLVLHKSGRCVGSPAPANNYWSHTLSGRYRLTQRGVYFQLSGVSTHPLAGPYSFVSEGRLYKRGKHLRLEAIVKTINAPSDRYDMHEYRLGSPYIYNLDTRTFGTPVVIK